MSAPIPTEIVRNNIRDKIGERSVKVTKMAIFKAIGKQKKIDISIFSFLHRRKSWQSSFEFAPIDAPEKPLATERSQAAFGFSSSLMYPGSLPAQQSWTTG